MYEYTPDPQSAEGFPSARISVAFFRVDDFGGSWQLFYIDLVAYSRNPK
jgi:hypothetical protein